MDSHPLPNTTQSSQDKKNNQKLKHHAPPPTTTSSPTHEFSFAVSLHNSIPTSAATDLSPADEIFFHGHLLPLRLLSGHLPHPASISPRSSTASLETSGGVVISPAIIRNNSPKHIRPAKKSKSFSLFGLPGWKQSGERDESRKKMKKFTRLIKRYMAMVKKPLISFKQQWRGGEEDDNDNDIEICIDRDSSYSFSGQIIGGGGGGGGGGRSSNNNKFIKKKQEYSSAPASMRTSPTNSGLLVPVPTMQSDNSSSMEELQAAIQAAIAHCKNSIATADQGGKLVKGLTS